MPEYTPFRNQADAKSPWTLDEDTRRGFAQAVTNNQPQMALYYIQEIIKAYDVEIAFLRLELNKFRTEISSKAAAPRTTTAKKSTDTEQ